MVGESLTYEAHFVGLDALFANLVGSERVKQALDVAALHASPSAITFDLVVALVDDLWINTSMKALVIPQQRQPFSIYCRGIHLRNAARSRCQTTRL